MVYYDGPSKLAAAYISCFYKKGSQKDPTNYRGISIGANMSRILSKIIVGRIKDAYEKHLSETQFGFRKNRSTTDGIFILKNVIQKTKEPLIAIYVDLSAAYDHIPRDFLFRVLKMRLKAPHIIDVLHLMYAGTTASILL